MDKSKNRSGGMESKQKQFNAAMALYEKKARYRLLGVGVSIANIALQIYTLVNAFALSVGFGWQIAAIAASYLVTDFVNGLIHLYMDHNDQYESWAGPLIANFHLHHRTPRYQDNHVIAVYFYETGSKVWLVFYLAAVAALFHVPGINAVLLYTLTWIGILSSVAEVSHYLAHNSMSPAALFLARIKLLLPKRQHATHHLQDNTSFTFLNGITDPLVNRIAKRFFPGYKHTTDLHYATYSATSLPRR
ncbi:MAG: fatty acid desaturase family protein [Deltaproteobacteria bacterium]